MKTIIKCDNQVFYVIFFVINLFFHLAHGLSQIQSDKEKHVKQIEVQAVEGRTIALPCSLAAPSRDKVYMVLWFRDDAGIPLYSFDVRGKPLSQARHWTSPEIFGPRAKFNTDTDPAQLEIEDIRRHDEGVYRCRVDFRTSQTQSVRYNLSIIILPEHPVVMNRWGRNLNGTLLGPKEEGDDIILTCRVVGGRPQPDVRWLVNGVLVDDQCEHNSGDVIENRLLWPSVQRSDLNSIFTCQALNTMRIEPKESSFVLDLHLKPLTVDIINPQTPLIADRRYEISCKTTGSRPNAIITWYKGKRQLKRTKEETQNNVTQSELYFVPSTEDDGKSITCRAENPKVTGLYLEKTWKIDVVYPPLVTLHLGSPLASDDIKEGDDVYFECDVKANPNWRKLHWRHNDVIIPYNASSRIIRSNQSLVLQKVNRNSTGNYSCSAINQEGETVSNQISLRVKYAPICFTDRVIIVGAFRGEHLLVSCSVDADPPPRLFKWKFNNSGESVDIAKDKYYHNGSVGFLQYNPVTDSDYGTLSCFSSNEVGEQAHPCLFQVVLAGLPTIVKNCTINNQTEHTVDIQCLPGYNGGLPQVFVLELVSTKTGKLRYNITNPEEPYFVIDSLDSLMSAEYFDDMALKAIVFAVNQKGRSQGVVLKDFLLGNIAANPADFNNSSMQISPVLIGILLTLLLLCFVIFLRVYCVKTTSSTTTNNDLVRECKDVNSIIQQKQDLSKKNLKNSPRWQHSDIKIKDNTEFLEDERDPDVIPAQYVSEPDGIDNSYQPAGWANGSYYDSYPNHDIRPKNLLIIPPRAQISTNHHMVLSQQSTPSTTTTTKTDNDESTYPIDGGNLLNHKTATTTTTNIKAITTTSLPNGISNHHITNNSLQNHNDYDNINVHTIKNMLMTTRVPESCV